MTSEDNRIQIFTEDPSMTNHDSEFSRNEIRAFLFGLIDNMSKAEMLELMEDLEKRQQSKLVEKREHPRKQTLINITYSDSDHKRAFTDFIQDISAGGLFIETGIPLSVNQELILTFSLPGPENPIKIKGKIVRTDQKGLGVKFNEPIPDI